MKWARKHALINDSEYKTIMHSRRTLLYDIKGNIWTKKEIKKQFNVSVGAIEGAEECELIGLYILSTVSIKTYSLTV